MKIREGFVSNSSSSSFIIGFKNCEPSEEIILEAFNVSKDSPFHHMAELFAEWFYGRVLYYMDYGNDDDEDNEVKIIDKEWIRDSVSYYIGKEIDILTDEEIIETFAAIDNDPIEFVTDVYNGKIKCFTGSCSTNYFESIEGILARTKIHIDTDKLYLKKNKEW